MHTCKRFAKTVVPASQMSGWTADQVQIFALMHAVARHLPDLGTGCYKIENLQRYDKRCSGSSCKRFKNLDQQHTTVCSFSLKDATNRFQHTRDEVQAHSAVVKCARVRSQHSVDLRGRNRSRLHCSCLFVQASSWVPCVSEPNLHASITPCAAQQT